MLERIKERLLSVMNWSLDDLNDFRFSNTSVLHDPFLYEGMTTLVDRLHDIYTHQQTHPNDIVMVDTDYDTDGIMSACVLHAALSLFDIKHDIYVPKMHHGYGLNREAIDEMIAQASKSSHTIHTILTADNGSNAHDGVSYAKRNGMTVLVTDHHLASEPVENADAMINPNANDTTYPFKGNAGATVAWKMCLAYASKYAPDTLQWVEDLIVFAGMANLADVMPMLDENHYMTKMAVERLHPEVLHKTLSTHYPTPQYKHVMEGLAHLVIHMQVLRDQKRKLNGQKPSLLPTDEQLISWYISPLLNAPRRMIGDPSPAFEIFTTSNLEAKKRAIEYCVKLNDEKSIEKDAVMSQISDIALGHHANTLLVNTKHGIAGLISGTITEKTGNPTITFALEVDTPLKYLGFPSLSEDMVVNGSARSNDIPLPLIIDLINQYDDTIIAGGGGHANAAGYSVYAHRLGEFALLFDRCAHMLKRLMGEVPTEPVLKNHVTLAFTNGVDTMESLWMNLTQLSAYDVLETITFMESLKPFGNGFEGETTFDLFMIPSQLTQHQYDPTFWKTFKASVNGIEILTFSEDVAKDVKQAIASNDQQPRRYKVTLTANRFRGKTTPQLVIQSIGR